MGEASTQDDVRGEAIALEAEDEIRVPEAQELIAPPPSRFEE